MIEEGDREGDEGDYLDDPAWLVFPCCAVLVGPRFVHWQVGLSALYRGAGLFGEVGPPGTPACAPAGPWTTRALEPLASWTSRGAT